MSRLQSMIALPCPRCGNPERQLETTRKTGAGGTAHPRCLKCGSEQSSIITEDLARQLAEMARKRFH